MAENKNDEKSAPDAPKSKSAPKPATVYAKAGTTREAEPDAFGYARNTYRRTWR